MTEETITTFEDLALSPEILKAVRRMGFANPTPVQAQTIPAMMDGRDVIAKAPTGTGKTCAFGIPLIECLSPDSKDIQAVVVCPTRELCIQIAEELRQLQAEQVHHAKLRGVRLGGSDRNLRPGPGIKHVVSLVRNG